MRAIPTKARLRDLLGLTTDAQLVEFFTPISASAVSQWGEDEPIPEKRWLWVLVKRPDLGRADGEENGDDVAGAAANAPRAQGVEVQASREEGGVVHAAHSLASQRESGGRRRPGDSR